MGKLKPIDQITDDELDEQIDIYQNAYNDAMLDYNYAASNTYHAKYNRAQQIRSKLQKLKDRKEALS